MHHQPSPSDNKVSLHHVQMFPGAGCVITAPSHRGTVGKGDSSLLPPLLFSLPQVHTCLFPLVSQLCSQVSVGQHGTDLAPIQRL